MMVPGIELLAAADADVMTIDGCLCQVELNSLRRPLIGRPSDTKTCKYSYFHFIRPLSALFARKPTFYLSFLIAPSRTTSEMNNALRRATLRLSPALRTRLPTQTFSPTFCRCETAQTPFTRTFTTSKYFQQEQAATRDEDLSDRAHKRQVRKVTSGTSAQTLENDRPWHRMDSQAETGAGEEDLPKKEDMTKGKYSGYFD